MVAWESDAEATHPVDFGLVRNSFVTMFWQSSVLEGTAGWLRSHSYRVVELDAGRWSSDADMHEDVASALSFPDYYGRNLSALNDCMEDIASGDYGWDADADTGLVIVLRAFDAFTAMSSETAQVVLDIFARQARRAILSGHRIICLVQSNDPRLAFEPVGATPVIWNNAEWLDFKRGL